MNQPSPKIYTIQVREKHVRRPSRGFGEPVDVPPRRGEGWTELYPGTPKVEFEVASNEVAQQNARYKSREYRVYPRSIAHIAGEVYEGWPNPVVLPMMSVRHAGDSHKGVSAVDIVKNFLRNARSFKGERAEQIKDELRVVIGEKASSSSHRKLMR